MTKQKSSFFERLTGAKNIQGDEYGEPLPVYTEEREEIITMREPSPAFAIRNEESWEPTTREEVGENDNAEGQLTIDVYQTENDIVIKSTIAGVKPEDLDVSINNDMVTIKGERKNEEDVENGNYYYQECYWGSFSRSVLLPVDVLPEKVDAALKNGILTIRLPKADTTKTKKIQVRGF
ncbi:MAG: Hsp20/alpha crystallin family protein [Candidatus Moranbacteria bacterium]|nr:Hsp20/alpha crystallin family protein [Candidatus Moranbacteria bacterium]MDD3965207.1 Hsp20/alpha crystallin family protein [Candidatus Moranbacteria bacterium]